MIPGTKVITPVGFGVFVQPGAGGKLYVRSDATNDVASFDPEQVHPVAQSYSWQRDVARPPGGLCLVQVASGESFLALWGDRQDRGPGFVCKHTGRELSFVVAWIRLSELLP